MSTRSYTILTGVETDTLPSSGSIESSYVSSKNADYTITDTDDIGTLILTGSVSKTFTLPTAADNTNRKITFINNSTATLTIDGEGSETINGNLTAVIYNGYDSLTLQCNGTSWFSITNNYTRTILTEQAVGTVGSASQIQAGNIPTTDLLGSGTDIAYYKFNTGALTTDEEGTYTLTNVNTVAEADGIFGSKNAVEFNGSSNYFTNSTLLDVAPTNGLGISFFIKPDDGQPAAASYLIYKKNSVANDILALYLDTNGTINLSTNGASGTAKAIKSSTILANGAASIWTHVAISWNSTSGISLYINGILEARDSTATTYLTNGTTTDLFIGAISTPTSYYDGKMSHVNFIDKVITQKDVDLLYATKLAISPAFSGTTYQVWGTCKEDGSASYLSQFIPSEVHRTTSALYLHGNQWHSTSDLISIKGRE